MSGAQREAKPTRRARGVALKFAAVFLFFALAALSHTRHATTQNPVFGGKIDINQADLLGGKYPLNQVIEAGGQFWTTPFTQYDAQTKAGDGYGEGAAGPRASQRKAFNPNVVNYPYLRLNGLDSQSCYECHNSIGSDPGYGAGSALIRKQPTSVGGSAGSNSNAFINPCFPGQITLFIRQPPHVFGSAYVQTIGDEITLTLYDLRARARQAARQNPGKPQSVRLVDPARNLDYGTFKTTYTKGTKWTLLNDVSPCPSSPCKSAAPARAALTTRPPRPSAPTAAAQDGGDLGAIQAPGFTDDVGKVKGVASDLIVRPFQWKGISSSLRHFVRDALDFHFSMQAAEKVSSCDCDKDGKSGPDNEVSTGNVSAITAFVGMNRPPQQEPPDGVSDDSVARGYAIFTATAPDLKGKLSGQMCATCHVPSLPITAPSPQFVIDSPVVNRSFNCPGDCPTEATPTYGSLITPLASHADLPVIKRIKALKSGAASPDPTYNIPLNSADVPPAALPRLTQTAPFFMPFLPQPPSGAFYVPLFSDLQTHDMGTGLADQTAQGADVAQVCIAPRLFLTRPLWGVADTGPWLHDGRATSLLQAILMHGGSGTGSEAGPVVDAFQKLSSNDQQAVVNFLLSLRLPFEQPQTRTAHR